MRRCHPDKQYTVVGKDIRKCTEGVNVTETRTIILACIEQDYYTQMQYIVRI